MKKPNLRKTFGMLVALVTGGLTIAIALAPQYALAASEYAKSGAIEYGTRHGECCLN